MNGSVIVSAIPTNVIINIADLGISVSVINDTINQTKSLVIDLTSYNTNSGKVCGLCGSLNGDLVHSDAVTIVPKREQENTCRCLPVAGRSTLGSRYSDMQTRECGET